MSDGNEITNLKSLIRSSIFSAKNKQCKRVIVTFFGSEVEIRQPSLAEILNEPTSKQPAGQEITKDPLEAGLAVLLKYTYVPGTDDHVFDESDIEALGSLPFGADFQNIITQFNLLTDVKVDTTEKK
jgi:hypothetical protein